MARKSEVLRSYQASVLQALVRALARERGATFTVLFPRQAGKNELAAALVVALLRQHAAEGGSIVVCAPTLAPQGEISLERVRRTLEATAHLFPAAPLVARGNRLEAGQAVAVFLAASPLANVAGHTASLALIADEAQDIDPEWFERQFRPMAASTGACTVLFGTPWQGESLLDLAVAANRRHDAARPGRKFRDWLPRHYEVAWEVVAEAVPAYGAYVRAERERLGESHPLFRTQYGLETLYESGRLLSNEQLARLAGSHARRRAPVPGERYIAGLDIAGEGADRTVLTIARLEGERAEVVEHAAWEADAYDVVGNEVLELARRWRFERLCVDATGLGQPLAQRLLRDLGRLVEPLAFTAASKSELGYGLIAAAETGRVALYADDGSRESVACRAELRECGAAYLAAGQLRWGSRSGHDDYAVSLALCLRAAAGVGGARVARGRRRE